MFPSLQVSNIIESGLSVYKNKKERQQLSTAIFLTRKKTPTPRPSAENDVTDTGGDAAPSEELHCNLRGE